MDDNDDDDDDDSLISLLFLLLLLQGYQSGSGFETCCPDAVVVAASYWKHRSHLLYVLHHLRHPRRSGSLPHCFGFHVFARFILRLRHVVTFALIFRHSWFTAQFIKLK